MFFKAALPPEENPAFMLLKLPIDQDSNRHSNPPDIRPVQNASESDIPLALASLVAEAAAEAVVAEVAEVAEEVVAEATNE